MRRQAWCCYGSGAVLHLSGLNTSRVAWGDYNYFRDYDAQTGRYVESDAIGLRGGINTYGYVGSHPTDRIDPLGLWSPGGHDALYNDAFNGILDPADIAAIQQESRALDRSTGVSTEDAYIHSMRKPGQSPEAAKAASKNYICAKLAAARGDLTRAQALRDFADAAHTITDSFSPEHTKRNGDPRLWFPLLFPGHSPNDHVGRETVHDITPDIYLRSMAALINAYNQAFGGPQNADCGCQ